MYVVTFKKVIIYDYNRITIDEFQYVILHNNSDNLFHYQFKSHLPTLKHFRTNKLNNDQFQIVFFTQLHIAHYQYLLYGKISIRNCKRPMLCRFLLRRARIFGVVQHGGSYVEKFISVLLRDLVQFLDRLYHWYSYIFVAKDPTVTLWSLANHINPSFDKGIPILASKFHKVAQLGTSDHVTGATIGKNVYTICRDQPPLCSDIHLLGDQDCWFFQHVSPMSYTTPTG